METFTFLHLLLLAAGASCYVCKPSGQRCYSQDHPYHVRLVQQMVEDEDVIRLFGILDPFRVCSGTLIHEQWVLTAGKCYYETNWYSNIPNPLKVKFSARSGEYQIIPHENIRMFINDSNADNNIMLVKLPKPASNIVTAQLPTLPCTRPEIGEKLFGVHCHYIPYDSDTVKIHLICTKRNVTACGRKTSSALFCATAIMNIAPFFSCPEDTGGPILRREGAADVIYGVKVSNYKFKFMDLCAEPVRQWINETINEP